MYLMLITFYLRNRKKILHNRDRLSGYKKYKLVMLSKKDFAREKNSTKKLANQIVSFYNEYDLKISGKINDQTAYQLIETIEKKYDTDKIALVDGTRLWNLIRVFIYSNYQKLEGKIKEEKLRKSNIKSILSLIKESFIPLQVKNKTPVCGFSSVESRRIYKNTYYDIYLDPLYEILDDNLTVFEWPETTGYRRKYDAFIYSKNYVPMHIPLYTNTFWDLLFYKMKGRHNFRIQSENILNEIIEFVSNNASVDKGKLTKDIYDFITVFVYIKQFLHNILEKISPKIVLIRCGYGRFPMALSQACRELEIPSIELQHGLITAYQPAYRRTTPTDNKDCIPEYLLAHGEIFAEMVKNGNLFDKDKVITTGFLFLENSLKEKNYTKLKKTFSSFKQNILFTSQWIVASEIKEFVIKLAEQLQNTDIGILFKPHPYDKADYSKLSKYQNIININKYEDTFKLFTKADIHATVYSTSGLEAMAFGMPNIFVDINNIIKVKDTPYIVASPNQFIQSMKHIFSNYEDASKEMIAVAKLFFTPNPEKNFKYFFNNFKILG